MKRMLAALSLACVISADAFGAPVTFDFTGSTTADSISKMFSAGGVSVTVTSGGTFTGSAGPSLVTQAITGLGAIATTPGVTGDPSSELSAFAPPLGLGPTFENFLDLTFSEAVTLTGVSMLEFDGDDDYGLDVDAVSLTGPNAITVATLDATTLGTAAARTGTTFRIKTDATSGTLTRPAEGDSFRVASITVDVSRPATVPVPGAAWMGLSLLVGLGVARGVKRHGMA